MSASNQEPSAIIHENQADYETILADIRQRYDEPLEQLPYDDATELVNAAHELADDTLLEEEQEDFEQMLEDLDEEYISSHWTNTEGTDIIFYGAWRDPDNEDAWISRSAYDDDPFTAGETGFQ